MEVAARIEGMYLGLACGDALGAPVEFMEASLLRRRYGKLREMIGAGALAPGEGGDETSMALATARGFLDRPGDPVRGVGRRLLEWGDRSGDVPRVIRAALRRQRSLEDWEAAARGTPQAQSGEAAESSALVRCLAAAAVETDPDRRIALASRLSALTHWDPQAEVGAILVTEWLAALLAGAPAPAAWSTARQRAFAAFDSPQPTPGTPGRAVPRGFREQIEAIEGLSWEGLQPSGYAEYVVETLEAAVWCALFSSDAEEAIVAAVALGGAADTLGALTGAAVGAAGGVAGLPTRWRERLVHREALTEAAAGLAALRSERAT